MASVQANSSLKSNRKRNAKIKKFANERKKIKTGHKKRKHKRNEFCTNFKLGVHNLHTKDTIKEPKEVQERTSESIQSCDTSVDKKHNKKRSLKHQHKEQHGEILIKRQKKNNADSMSANAVNKQTLPSLLHVEKPHRRNCMKHKRKDKSKERESKFHIATELGSQRTDSRNESNSQKLQENFENSKQTYKFGKGRKISSIKSTRPEIWFDDVDEALLEDAQEKPLKKVTNSSNPLVKEKSFEGLTRTVAMDCEMVGVGPDRKDSILARVSIVNQFGKCIYDKFVKPTEKVTDYRTAVSGVRPKDVANGLDFHTVQQDVSDILRNRLLVGHAIHNDLKVLYLDHPHKMIRDTLRYKPFRQVTQGRRPSLKKLSARVLGVSVQEGEHSSVQDAQAAMRLYTMHKSKWEAECAQLFKKKPIHKRKRPTKRKKPTDFSINLDSD